MYQCKSIISVYINTHCMMSFSETWGAQFHSTIPHERVPNNLDYKLRGPLSIPDAPCMEYLPTKLGHFWGFFVGHTPRIRSIWEWTTIRTEPQQGILCRSLAGYEFHSVAGWLGTHLSIPSWRMNFSSRIHETMKNIPYGSIWCY